MEIKDIIPSKETCKKIIVPFATAYGICYYGRNVLRLNPMHAAIFVAVSRVANLFSEYCANKVASLKGSNCNSYRYEVVEIAARATNLGLNIAIPCAAAVYGLGVTKTIVLVDFLGITTLTSAVYYSLFGHTPLIQKWS